MSTSPADDGPPVDSSPLLFAFAGEDSGLHGSGRRPGLFTAAQFLRRASSRPMMRNPSMAVRETAAEHLEERRTDWAYSKPVVVLDAFWNLTFVAAAAGILVSSREESPSVPLRVWIVGYALQCLLHVGLVYIEYRRRRHLVGGGSSRGRRSPGRSYSWEQVEAGLNGGQLGTDEGGRDSSSLAKHLESANTMFSFIWWIIGFYWASVGGQILTLDSPKLYWLCIAFLACDVFFVVLFVAVACFAGLAVCCCFPCIIAILYAVEKQGASDEDICQLPTFKFHKNADHEMITGGTQSGCGGMLIECGSDSPSEHILSAEDAECCICLSAYDDGDELRLLPCKHHFHSNCIRKWLLINAACPLCKSNIVNSNINRGEEV